MNIVIAQPQIIYGGRIKVLLGITEAINELGWTPTWVSREFPGARNEIADRYQSDAQFEMETISLTGNPRGERARVAFNELAAQWCGQNGVDWIVNSSNTVQGFLKFENIISYVHFPREARAAHRLGDLHDPTSTRHIFQLDYWRKKYSQYVYGGGQVNSDHRVLCNSQFSLDHWQGFYRDLKLNHVPQVLYPFADDVPLPLPDGRNKSAAIASLGRFCPAKRQRQQLDIAANASNLEFRIMGHAEPTDGYFNHWFNMLMTQI